MTTTFLIEKQGEVFGYTHPHNEVEYTNFESEAQLILHYYLSLMHDDMAQVQEAFMHCIENPYFAPLAAIFFEWKVDFDFFENLHDVCDPNQALIDAFFQDEDFDNEEAMAKTTELSNQIMAAWNQTIKTLKIVEFI